ncbi:MAG TPA: DUF2232 domain-containing protein, partial [Acidimicrobiia bacterium]|nr:DUF2232 domain-containing protein [Acidimicrobiia bacterium]
MRREPAVERRPSRRGRLRPDELAEAVILADLTLALCLVGHVLPLASALFAAAIVPMAAVSARHRLRAVVAGTAAACVVGFLIAGGGLLTSVITCCLLGAVAGRATRHSWGLARTVLTGVLILWPLASGLTVAAMYVLSDLRQLLITQVRNSWLGTARFLREIGLPNVAHAGDVTTRWLTRNWWAGAPAILLVLVAAAVGVSWFFAYPTVRRVRSALGDPRDPGPPAVESAAPAPVPLVLRDVAYQYADGHQALDGVSLDLPAGTLVAVTGANGSGKSTLARVLVGRPPTSGEVRRAGPAGLGHHGGSAIVFQRPEAQVLGVRVRDDIGWGIPRDAEVDLDGILERVGLAALADRDTSTLSGGELQRLALGAALARAPQLLVSDESTSMVDPDGRERIVGLLRDAADDGVTVVHVTHRPEETDVADRVITLARGRVSATPANPPELPVLPAAAPVPSHAAPLLQLRGVGHVYAQGTPWATRALTDVDLDLSAGEGLLVLGHNGSGKSTLAWVLAGLLRPTEGDALLEGRPLHEQVGHVALSFQHSRLQLLRPTVGSDVAAASGADPATVDATLELVGLDPAVFASRRVDELSGGETRRVALAGMLARRPRVLVLDEPFAGLDASGRASLASMLVRLREVDGITVVIVSHDPELTPHLVDQVLRLERGRVLPPAAVGREP